MNRPLNLMHLVWGLGNGGMENTLIDVCNLLPPDEFNPSICVFESGESKEYRVDAARVEVIHVAKRFGNDFTVSFRLARQMRRRRIDILHTNLWGTLLEGMLAAKLARIPIVVHEEHGTLHDRRRQIVAQRWAWRKMDRILAVSDALADRMARVVGFPRERIDVIPNGVDTDRFRPSDAPNSDIRRELGLPPGGFLIGMVARFVPFKDHAGMLQALAKLREANVDARLALAGDGPLREELECLAGRLGITDRVHFLGEIRCVEKLLRGLDVLVSNSSHNEGMSFTVLEAMASGVPVVATRVAAAPEQLDGGNAGLLIRPRDTESLVHALQQLLGSRELGASLRKAGRQRVLQRYSVSSMVESYRCLYLRLAGVEAVGPGEQPASAAGTGRQQIAGESLYCYSERKP